MAIEMNSRTRILTGVVVLLAAAAGAWFFLFEEDGPTPKAVLKPRAKAEPAKPAEAPKTAAKDEVPKAADAPKPAADAARPAAEAPKPAAEPAKVTEAAKPAAAPKPAAEPVGYQRPANIRELYTRYNDLITATVMRDRAAVKELLDDGKSPNMRQADGSTPLMIAAGNDDAEIAGMLLAKGADPNARATGGASALSVAKSRGAAGAGMVQLLQRAGAKE